MLLRVTVNTHELSFLTSIAPHIVSASVRRFLRIGNSNEIRRAPEVHCPYLDPGLHLGKTLVLPDALGTRPQVDFTRLKKVLKKIFLLKGTASEPVLSAAEWMRKYFAQNVASAAEVRFCFASHFFSTC